MGHHTHTNVKKFKKITACNRGYDYDNHFIAAPDTEIFKRGGGGGGRKFFNFKIRYFVVGTV